jgi:hypothetical protein
MKQTRIWDFHSGECEEYCLLGWTPCSVIEVHQRFGGAFYHHLQYGLIFKTSKQSPGFIFSGIGTSDPKHISSMGRLCMLHASFWSLDLLFDLEGRAVRQPLFGLFYQPRMIDGEFGAVDEMRIGRGNRSIWRKIAAAPLCPPQTSRPGRFTPGEMAPGTHWIWGWVDPRAGLDDVEKRKFLTIPRLELRPLGRPARSQSLYRLLYPVIFFIN